MADEKSIHDDNQKQQPDPFAGAAIYRLRRDALMIVSNQNRGRAVGNEAMKRQLVFIQGQLAAAAVADPRLSEVVKTALVEFQASTVSENIADRRGSRRRRPVRRMNAA